MSVSLELSRTLSNDRSRGWAEPIRAPMSRDGGFNDKTKQVYITQSLELMYLSTCKPHIVVGSPVDCCLVFAFQSRQGQIYETS